MSGDTTSSESKVIEERQELRAPVIYETVRRSGEAELRRPVSALWWSGVAAGIAMSASLLAEGALRRYLPDAPWRPAVDNFGYTIGFLIVMAGRLQLFTENTVTAVLPLLATRAREDLRRTARLWLVVFAANLVGALSAAVLIAHGGVTPEPFLAPMLAVSQHLADKTPADALLHGIPAGFLIASLVWAAPSADGAHLLLVLIITYVIALLDFSHVVAGSVEVFLLIVTGHLTLLSGFFGLILPMLLGNILGGTGLFALIAYAQVREEIKE